MDVTKANIAKRKGGRTSRSSATKKTKTSETQKDETTENVTVNEVVPLPSTPNLEKEALSTTAIEDRMEVEVEVEDKEITVAVKAGPGEEGTTENSMLGASGEGETETDILAPLESIESGGMLCFNDIMDNELLETNGDLTLLSEWGENRVAVNVEERDNSSSGNLTTSPNQKVTNNNEELDSSGNVSSNIGDCGDRNSCCSITSCLVDDCNLVDNFDWDWESVVQRNEIWDDKEEQMPTWPWEIDSNDKEEEERHNKIDDSSDFERQNSMVAWLFS
ncbi:hypothetical protein CCACVL1_22153 [Corchorus capsularis]|uniref:Uncharacterized protein n=1 Tax=Corchorus capsularis TaxID=210143 RepID=A0A1R3H0S7_COCAP|nr:hypothetical protein CCACVL1_22153 [Corchorus capsularis]